MTPRSCAPSSSSLTTGTTGRRSWRTSITPTSTSPPPRLWTARSIPTSACISAATLLISQCPRARIALCKTLDKTPIDKLEEALRPMLDIDSVLWFLALDNAVINDDGYWTRNSDYELYRDPKGVFHIVAHDTNETFQAMGFGFG